MIQTSPEIKELFKALLEAQKKLPKIIKDKQGHRSKYADLNQVIEKTLPVLSDENLVITQLNASEGDFVGASTMLGHAESGQWIANTCMIKQRQADPQEAGSIITYMRRYGWQSILGINAEEDDDGAGASKPVKKADPFKEPSNFKKPEATVVEEEDDLDFGMSPKQKTHVWMKKNKIDEKFFVKLCRDGNLAGPEVMNFEEIPDQTFEGLTDVDKSAILKRWVQNSHENAPYSRAKGSRRPFDGNPYTNTPQSELMGVKLGFGEHKNKTISEVPKDYVEWMYEKWTPKEYKGKVPDNQFKVEAALIRFVEGD